MLRELNLNEMETVSGGVYQGEIVVTGQINRWATSTTPDGLAEMGIFDAQSALVGGTQFGTYGGAQTIMTGDTWRAIGLPETSTPPETPVADDTNSDDRNTAMCQLSAIGAGCSEGAKHATRGKKGPVAGGMLILGCASGVATGGVAAAMICE